MLPFAAGNFLGPLVLGRLFDTLGRRPMIAFTYAISAVLLVISGDLFQQELLTARGRPRPGGGVLLRVGRGELRLPHRQRDFPLEIRALAIAAFYAIGTGIGGVAGPALFGALVELGSRLSILGGYLFGSALMLAAAVVAWMWGVAAERKPLESVARPLAFRD